MSVKKFLFLLHFRANDRLKMGGGLLAAAMGQTMLTCLVHRYLVKIAWHGPEEMSSSLATSLTMFNLLSPNHALLLLLHFCLIKDV